jgi:Spy/CpxP family protein refolding chaperone
MLKAVLSTALVLTLSLVFVADASAQRKERRREGRPGGRPNFSRVDMMVMGLTLTDVQKTKVAELKKEYDPKFKESREKLDSILTEEQKKARKEAVDKARADGKQGKEAWDAAVAAVKLTPEQQKKMDEAKKASDALDKEVREKVEALLTPEQKEQQKKMREEMQKRRGPPPPIN